MDAILGTIENYLRGGIEVDGYKWLFVD